MDVDFIAVAKRILLDNMALKEGESLLVIYDETTLCIGESLFEAGCEIGAASMAMRIRKMAKNGMEPPPPVARAMAAANVVIAPTGASLTHTQARKTACAEGARVATMPGITEDMFFQGPITADYNQVKVLSEKAGALLTGAKTAELRTGNGAILTMSLEGRRGVVSSGVYRNRGESGNLPSGEAYIAPVEGSAEGEVLIDGSFVGIGLLRSPLKLIFEKGLLVKAEGEEGRKVEAMLAGNPLGGNLGELGIGTNDRARLTGVILEDEKIYGTVHIALGSNDTFGGTVAAGIHVDGVITRPDLYLDGKPVVRGGKLLV